MKKKSKVTIGMWIVRLSSAGVFTKSHLVESVVAGDVITKCGRRMRNETKGALMASPTVRCKICSICSGE